ncbi:thioredoxin family protein [Peribacillus sp. SCS-155]|uniref:thioredoxin family protein n=1 Tax=Peribacillus sedimenti TaxID=3115297 RepID=UPI0039068771
MSSLNTWFQKGMNNEQYLAYMQTHKENLLGVYEKFQLTEQDKQVLSELKSKGLRTIVLTADWCGDAMVNIPILMKIAEEAGIEIRYLVRDENLELMDQYLTNGTARSIPIFIFIDSDGNEVGKWGPRAKVVQSFVDELRSTMPAKEDPSFDAAFKLFIDAVTTRFTTDEDLWVEIKKDIIATLK